MNADHLKWSLKKMNTTANMELSEFLKLLSSKDWKRSSYVEALDIYEDEIEDEDGIKHPVTRVYGLGSVDSTHGNIIVSYSEGYEYETGDKESFKTSTEGMDAPWGLYGVTLVADGVPIDFEWGALPSEFSAVDYELVKSGI